MKNILILFALLISCSRVLAAEPQTPPMTMSAVPACSVYVANNNVVIQNNSNSPADISITGKYGTSVVKAKVANKQLVPVKDLQVGQYLIKVKTQDGERNIKLCIL